jgi:hypothetical protein
MSYASDSESRGLQKGTPKNGEPDTKDGVKPLDFNSIRNPPAGKLDVLEKNKYMTQETLRYPYEGKNNKERRYPHYMKFNICIPEKSKYVTEKALTMEDGTGLSTTEQNQQALGLQLGSSADPFNVGIAATAGTVVGAVVGFQSALNEIQRQSRLGGLGGAGAFGKILSSAGKAIGKGAGISAAIAGGASTAILSIVDVSRKTKRIKQVIELYIPDQVVAVSENKYNEVSLTKALGLAGFAAQGAIAGALTADTILGLAQNGSGIAGMKSTGSPVLNEAVGTILGGAGKKLGAFGEGIENVLLQSFGFAQNPQIEILFDTVDLRSFEFTFNFLPRSKEEADIVMKIIRTFRFHAAPEIVTGYAGRYYVPPSEFDIEYRFVDTEGNDQRNDAIHRFATCVLEKVDVNYTGSAGQFVTFADGIPVNVEMRLRFKEVEIIHKQLVDAGF